MRDMNKYKDMKIEILTKAKDGLITEAQCDELLKTLEVKMEAAELTDEKIKDFFDQLKDKYPEAEEDIEKLIKKLDKAEESEEVSEAAIELMELIDSLTN